jgi:hypothetical protein
MSEVNDWVRSNVRAEIVIDSSGQQEGMKVRAESDTEVQKALELLPKAKELADNARRIIAERNGARSVAGAADNNR